jgi:hypothetical protein
MSPSSSSGAKSASVDLRAAKDKVFAKLAELDCVSGVGIADSKLAVYLTRPLAQDETRHIKDVVSAEAPGQDVTLVTTGPFEKQ